MNRITKSSARGYAADVAIEALVEDLICHPEVFPDSESRIEAEALVWAMIRSAPRRNRRYWVVEMKRRPLP